MSKPTDPESPTSKAGAVIVTDTLADAQDANAQEHELGLWEAVKLYPKGIFWSIMMSTVVIMEGYDTKVLTTLFAQPTFQKAFGVKSKKGSYQISAPWQTGLGNGSVIGMLIGIYLAGYLSERFGFRRTIMLGLVTLTAFIFIQFFANSLAVLLVGQILCGIPLGMFQTTTVTYAHEIVPMTLRPYLTNYVNLCWAFGQIIATGILRGVLHRTDEWAYRIPFAVQWVWPVILLPVIFFAPESPWWLIRKGRVQEAREVLQRLASPRNVNYNLDKNITLIVVTTEHEREVEAGSSYWACFKGTNLKRTLIAIGIYLIQTLNGNALRGYSTYFLQQAGLPITESFNMTIVGFALAIVGGLASWILLPLMGRRTIYLWSLVMMFVIMILVGALGVPQAQTKQPSYAWGIGSMLLISSFLYYCTIGPLTNTIVTEISSSLVRSKSISIARWVYTVSGIVAGVLTPYQLNPTAWNWAAKTGFFWAGGCLISILFAYFYCPETKDRTTAEMDILFERKVSPRHFRDTHIDLAEAISGHEEQAVHSKES